MEEASYVSHHSKTEGELKAEQKVGIFHLMGKYLYAKRKNHEYNPLAKNKAQKEYSRYYTEEEIKLYDPKFYFNPIQMFESSNMTLNNFVLYSFFYLDFFSKTTSTVSARSETWLT